MAKFLSKLTTTEISDSIFAVAYKPLVYQSDLLVQIITVPVGFFTDFASVPRWVPMVYACLGDTAHEPAVVHDWLYYAAITNRRHADDILLEAMAVCGIPSWRRYPIYWGVRIGGWKAWNEHRKVGNPKDGKFKDSPNIIQKPVA